MLFLALWLLYAKKAVTGVTYPYQALAVEHRDIFNTGKMYNRFMLLWQRDYKFASSIVDKRHGAPRRLWRTAMIHDISVDLHLIGKTIIKPERSFSFNAYLLTGEKNILIDTVPDKAGEVFFEEVASIVPLERLDAFILNHSEADHSGALPLLLRARPDIPVYCTAACAERLRQNHDIPHIRQVKTDESLQLGEHILSFIETPGLHWDDNMATYWENGRTLFSNDLFGQYVGRQPPVDSEVDDEVFQTAVQDYFKKVFAQASAEEKSVITRLAGLPLRRIAPGHGVVVEEKLPVLLAMYKELINVNG